MRKQFFFLDYSFFRRIFLLLRDNHVGIRFCFWTRHSFIIPFFRGHVFFFYNGIRLSRLVITRNMFFYRFGDFVFTKLRGFSIHFRKKKS